MQIMSQPEDVQTIESTLLVLGVNDTTPLGQKTDQQTCGCFRPRENAPNWRYTFGLNVIQ